MPKLKRGSSGPRPKDKVQRNSNSIKNRIATSVPRDFNSDEFDATSSAQTRSNSESISQPMISSFYVQFTATSNISKSPGKAIK